MWFGSWAEVVICYCSSRVSRRGQLTEAGLARPTVPLPGLTSLNCTHSLSMVHGATVSPRTRRFSKRTLFLPSLPQSPEHPKCLNHPRNPCSNPCATGEVRSSRLFFVPKPHVPHSTNWRLSIHRQTRLTCHRKLGAAYTDSHTHHSSTCSTLPGLPHDVPASPAVLVISEPQQLQDRRGGYYSCVEWAVRFACYAKEPSTFNSAKAQPPTTELIRRQSVRNKFSVRGVVRGASLALCAVNVVGCGLAYTFGKREKEEKK